VSIVSWVVVGLVAGVVARLVVPGRRMGCLFTVAVGIIGGLVGGALFHAAGQRGINDFSIWSIFVSTVGAIALLWVLESIRTSR